MRFIILLSAFVSFAAFSQKWESLEPKKDSVSGKFGFVDSTQSFVILPMFDAVRDFVSAYTSVKIDTLWGIIDEHGDYKFKPQFEELSIVYRDHFLEDGENMKFRSITGKILYEYLYIPGPFDQMKDFQTDSEVRKMDDFELIRRIFQMYGGRPPCHYYSLYRIYNSIAIGSSKYGKMTIDFVLDNPSRVAKWIENDKEFEAAFERGEIDCCGYGPVWYGE